MPSPLHFAHFEVLTHSDGSPVVLGQGAMGVTLKALDTNLLSVVVIKVLSPECQAVPSVRQRFLQEAQMMARVRHPHVASVFFYGDSPSGAFYAMEFCEGTTLHEFVRDNGPLAWADAFRIAQQAASALQALHANDLVHRDLKPSNIILARDASTGVHVKLIDFGVAREGQRADSGGLTQSGFVGTPAYASPEQLLEDMNLDVRSDFYSLGAVLWFCLTGKQVFEGAAFDVMFHHVNTEPDWEKLPTLPAAATALMKRLLAKSADDRPASPTVLQDELQSLFGEGSVGGLNLRLTGRYENLDMGGYEPVEEVGADAFGKVWRARDVLTGRIVALRVLSPEVAGKTALVSRIQRLSAFVRPLDHPRWQRVCHFEQKGRECRLAIEWVDGPALLALLKARQTLPLADVAPLLAQIAETMDFAASKGLAAVETAPERVVIQVTGWTAMLKSEQAKWLRHPLSMWPSWCVKICPLRLSLAAQDYALPSDTEAAQAISRIASDYVVLCSRLLTGQGRSAGVSYLPSPDLSSEANAHFERSLNPASPPATSCMEWLRALCGVEGVALPAPIPEAADPLATAPVPAPQPTPVPASARDTSIVALAPASTAVPPAASETNASLFQMAARTVASIRLKELEQRREELEREAAKLRIDERLEAERDWLARERGVLAEARHKVADEEAGRARRTAEEEAGMKQRKLLLDQQEALLEAKRRELQRLEEELQNRARGEYQNAGAQGSSLDPQRSAVEDSLREREAEFLAREQESIARLEALKAEAAALEHRVREEQNSLRNTEREQSRRHQEEQAVGSLAKEKLAAEERRLEQLRRELDGRLLEWKATRRKRVLSLTTVVVCGVVLAGLTAHFISPEVVEMHTLKGQEQWTGAATGRARAKAANDWAGLLDWCVALDKSLRGNPEYAEVLRKHQQELANDAEEAVTGLLQQPPASAEPASEEVTKILVNLEAIRDWHLSTQHWLLWAKLRMPEAAARGAGAEALKAYLAAVNVRPEFADELGNELDGAIRQLQDQLRDGKLEPTEELMGDLQAIGKTQARQRASGTMRLLDAILAEKARRGGKPDEALRLILQTVEIDPVRKDDLRPQAVEIVRQLAALPAGSLMEAAPSLRTAGDLWNLPDAYLALAPLEQQESARIDDYRRADEFGSMKARALVGRALLMEGVEHNNQDLKKKGAAKLREAVTAGDSDAMVLLGEALYAGRGVDENAGEAFKLAQQAEAKGHPEAFFLAAKAQLRLGESTHDPKMLEEAARKLETAVAQNLPRAALFLYLSQYNNTVKHVDRAVAALQKGTAARDPDCLFWHGLWMIAGQAPVKKNVSRGRSLIQEAAKLGNEKARDWLKTHP